MAPSDHTGNLLGSSQVHGLAHESSASELSQTRAILANRYGEMVQQIAGPDSEERTYIIVEPLVEA
jgi:hypothetical protein